MGPSLSTFFRLFFSKRDVRIVMIGLDAAGKTTVLNMLKRGETLPTIPTIGFHVDTIEYKNLKLTMWDVGGQHRLRDLWHHYYQNCDAVIFVVDAADRTRFADAQAALLRALEHADLQNASLLVFANKQDMPTAAPTAEVFEQMKLRHLPGSRKVFVQGCTATTGHGVWEGLDWLAANLPPRK